MIPLFTHPGRPAVEIQQNSDAAALLPFPPKIWEAPQAQLGNNLLQLLSGFPLGAAVRGGEHWSAFSAAFPLCFTRRAGPGEIPLLLEGLAGSCPRKNLLP